MLGKVIALSTSPEHTLTKQNQDSIELLAGLGIKGDAHMGKTVKHRSRVAQDPNQPNLRQVHLIHTELHKELANAGFHVKPGQMGENITTSGIDLLNLPRNTQLLVGPTVVLEVTGLRNPCSQLESIQEGLMKAVLDKNEYGEIVRKAGIMAVVVQGGEISTGDLIEVRLPQTPFIKLEKV